VPLPRTHAPRQTYTRHLFALAVWGVCSWATILAFVQGYVSGGADRESEVSGHRTLFGPLLLTSYRTDVCMCSVNLTGAERSERLGDVWYVLDAIWRTSQFMHLIAAAFDAVWQVSVENTPHYTIRVNIRVKTEDI